VCWAAVVDGYSGIDPDAGRTQAPDAATLDAARVPQVTSAK